MTVRRGATEAEGRRPSHGSGSLARIRSPRPRSVSALWTVVLPGASPWGACLPLRCALYRTGGRTARDAAGGPRAHSWRRSRTRHFSRLWGPWNYPQNPGHEPSQPLEHSAVSRAWCAFRRLIPPRGEPAVPRVESCLHDAELVPLGIRHYRPGHAIFLVRGVLCRAEPA
jgi:hypothetical protein